MTQLDPFIFKSGTETSDSLELTQCTILRLDQNNVSVEAEISGADAEYPVLSSSDVSLLFGSYPYSHFTSNVLMAVPAIRDS